LPPRHSKRSRRLLPRLKLWWAVIVTGDYVFVTSDLSPGKCSHGGNGYVIDFEGTGPDRTFTIQYDHCSIPGMKMERNVEYHGMKMERNTEYHGITQIPNPAFELTTTTHKCKATTSPNTSTSSESTSDSTVFEEEPLDVILERGWRC
jgi:hypothetical protein